MTHLFFYQSEFHTEPQQENIRCTLHPRNQLAACYRASSSTLLLNHLSLSVHAHVCVTCDGVMGEGLDVGQVVVRTVFLKPLAHVLLSPQHHGFGQTGQSWTRVVNSEGFSWTQLEHKRRQQFVNKCNCAFLLKITRLIKPCRLEHRFYIVPFHNKSERSMPIRDFYFLFGFSLMLNDSEKITDK